MIHREHELPIRRQCRLVRVARSTACYNAAGESEEELQLMRRIDELYLERPTRGSRSMQDCLDTDGYVVNRKRVQRLMRKMGLTAVYPKKTSQPSEGHRIYPYLLRGLRIDRSRQVYAADITYIPMAKGFLYLVAVIDWHSRKVPAHRVSNTLDAAFCVEALEEAIGRYGTPEIFNTDQGAQFTAAAFTDVLKRNEIRISMDGRGRWPDNIYVERLWRSLKYEEVYLKAYETVAEAKRSIATYLDDFNSRRRHRGIGRKTTDAVFWGARPERAAA
jgi:putative transposase